MAGHCLDILKRPPSRPFQEMATMSIRELIVSTTFAPADAGFWVRIVARDGSSAERVLSNARAFFHG